MKKALLILLTAAVMLTVGCNGKNASSDSVQEEPETYTEVQSFMGQSASYGGMTFTVSKAEDPGITMDNGNIAVFFEVSVKNDSEETVPANYLNNFTLTVDGKYLEANECCTIPVMKKLYDYYGVSAMAEEIPAGESSTGYIACEVGAGSQELKLHYIPKTTDRGSMITVPISVNELTKAD